MERLTYRGRDDRAYCNYGTRDIINKLAKYEDAEEQGLLLQLPCKLGDKLYFIGNKCDKCEEYDCYGCPYNKNKEERHKKFIHPITVKQFRVLKDSIEIVDTDSVWSSYEISMNMKEINKTLFLTKAEAEQKLKEMEND